MKQYTLINRVLAGVSFLVALVTYTLTLQPSVPFWDCGEFSAATAWQQVPHPPGAPLFLMVARWFHMIPVGDPGWRINMVSAVSSAFTALFVYLIIVKMIERWRPFKTDRTVMSFLPTFGGALIGALAFTWCDTQWFNSVESEVYAAGTLLIAVLIWLMMRWSEQAERPGHERYLLAIAYLVGLAFGVHLLALLVVPGVAMVIYFRKYPFTIPSFAGMLAITAVVFYFIVYKTPLQYIPKLVAANAAIGVVLMAALVGILWWSVREKKPIVYLSSASMIMILLGFSTYAHILVRANAHPAMNENEPDTVSELVSYLGREQYGEAPNWPRRYQTDDYYVHYQGNADVYGEWFPPEYNEATRKAEFNHVNTTGELTFMWKYQTQHMYLRYLLWNFAGRVSDIQDAGVSAFSVTKEERDQFITPTGYPDVFPVRFFALPLLLGLIGLYYHFKRDWKMALVYMTLFLLLGVIATWQQNQQQPQPRERDYFYVGSFMIFAMWIGIGATALAEKLGQAKKVEAEEASEGSVRGQGGGRVGVMAGVLALCLVAAPLNMAVGGWHLHDRSKNWVPWDYSYNILQSCEKDAILFCNGDNDTFPLWYLQDVAGIRRDVRIVNLSLGQTPWYIWQLKNERPWGAKKVPISFSDEMLRMPEGERGGLGPELVDKMPTVSLDVPADVMKWATNGKVTAPGTMSWAMRGGDYGGQQNNLLGVQHKLVRDIIETNKWQRPIYFSTSTGADVWCGLDNYFRPEGMAFRIMPVPQDQGALNADVMRKCLIETLPADQSFAEPHYGFKFRNLNDTKAYFMEDHRRLMLNYRMMFSRLAQYELSYEKDQKAAVAALDKMEQEISPDMFDMPPQISADIARMYKDAGALDKAKKYAERTIHLVDDEWSVHSRYGGDPNQIKAQMYEVMGDYDAAMKVYETQRQQNPADPDLRAQMEVIGLQKYLDKKDTAGAIAAIEKIIAGYGNDSSGVMQRNVAAFRQRLAELRGTPAASDNTSAVDTMAGKPVQAPARAR